MPRLRSLIGLPVLRGGKRIGRLTGVVCSEDGKTVRGIRVDRGFLGSRFIPREDIELLGEVCIPVSGKGIRSKEEAVPDMMRALTSDGRRAGAVTDLFLDGEDMTVEAVELSRGFFDDMVNGRERVSCFSFRPDGDVSVELRREGGEET